MIDAMRFLTYEDLDEIQMEFGTPCFVYDEATLRTNAREVLNFQRVWTVPTLRNESVLLRRSCGFLMRKIKNRCQFCP